LTALKKASKARRASSHATFQKLLRDRASFRREEALETERLRKLHQSTLDRTSSSSNEQTDSESEGSVSWDSQWESDDSDESDLGKPHQTSQSEFNDHSPVEKSLLLEDSLIGRPLSGSPQKRTIGPFWELDPCALSRKEEREISRNQRFARRSLPFGEYKVSPNRYDLQNFQRIFWIGREIRQLLIVISLSDYNSLFYKQLLSVRNQIFLLGNGSGKLTRFQRKLFASVYYCLRQCSPTKSRG